MVIPDHWQEINIYLVYDVLDATAGNIAWRLDRVSAGLGAVAANSNTSYIFAAAPGVAYQSARVQFAGQQAPPSRPFMIRVFRDPTNASDTYANYANLRAIVIERAA